MQEAERIFWLLERLREVRMEWFEGEGSLQFVVGNPFIDGWPSRSGAAVTREGSLGGSWCWSCWCRDCCDDSRSRSRSSFASTEEPRYRKSSWIDTAWTNTAWADTSTGWKSGGCVIGKWGCQRSGGKRKDNPGLETKNHFERLRADNFE